MRLDVSVNMFVHQAITNKKITIFGGDQIRPNIHIMDLCRVFLFFLKKKNDPGFYNAGFENLKIIEIGNKIKKYLNCEIKTIKQTNDPRSYRQDSTKLLRAGFEPKFNVNFAIKELIENFKLKKIKVSKNFFRVKFMKKIFKK
jgi:nucleoside-diphosphate-sugar epimerase